MKVCLYLEFRYSFGGALFKNIGTGLLSSYENQKVILKTAGIPFVEKWQNDCDILQTNTPWLKSVYLMKKAKKQGKGVIVWAHVTMEDAMQVFRFMPLVAPLFKRYLTYAYNQADCIFCPSQYTKGLLTNYGIDPQKLLVISNGVDLTKYHRDETLRTNYRQRFHLTKLTIGMVGLVIPRKGTKTFLRLAQEFPECQFIWYGSIYNKMLAEALPKNLPSNVQFTGFVEDIVAAFSSLDIFIFPSYEENQGMAIIEAGATKLPTLVRNLPVYKTWLFHQKNCLMADSEAAFRAQLKQLVNDAELRRQLGQAAYAMAKKEDIADIAVRVGAMYRQLSRSATQSGSTGSLTASQE